MTNLKTSRFWLAPLLLGYASAALATADGSAVFKANCVTCHGEKLDGSGPTGMYMNPKPRNLMTDKFKAGDDKETMFKTVSDGLNGTAMAGFSSTLSEDERHAVVEFVCSQRTGHCPAKKKGKKKD